MIECCNIKVPIFGNDSSDNITESVPVIVRRFMEGAKVNHHKTFEWYDLCAEFLLSAMIFYMLEDLPEKEWNWNTVLKLLDRSEIKLPDRLFIEYRNRCEREGRSSLAVKAYAIFINKSGNAGVIVLLYVYTLLITYLMSNYNSEKG